jgi:RecB family exonuclease
MTALIVYPSSRAIREASTALRQREGFLPRLMRMDEFLSRLAGVPGRSMIQGSQRIFRLREAAEFDGFGRLQSSRDLIRFFTRSEDLFRFFEELAWERVPLERLEEADAYAEYGEHLEILGELRRRYGAILEAEGLYDRMFLPELYRFNEGFVAQYEKVELHLEGYLSRFEMELLEQVAERTELVVHWRSTPFSEKMRRRFAEAGIELPALSRILFSWSRKRVLESEAAALELSPRVLSVQERYEQVAVTLAEIEGMVRGGIAPERIALVLPREEFKHAFALYDRMGNLNFSMGFDLKDREVYRTPEALLRWWRGAAAEDREWLVRLNAEALTELFPGARGGVEEFVGRMAAAKVPGFVDPETPREGDAREAELLAEFRHRFLRLYRGRELRDREWLFLWLRELEELRLDDVRGGKVTVMGVLETRGVTFDGVVIVDFNDGIVPATTGKDRFLDSRVRRFAGLPDRQDREALQKHYYARLLEEAKASVILYSRSDNRLPSRFLYELGLDEGRETAAPRELLYLHAPLSREERDPVVEPFDPAAMLWSASRLKHWLECRRRFYYRYIRGLEEKPSEEINEGLVLHRILDELYRQRDRFESEEALRRELERIAGRLLAGEEVRGLYLGAYWRKMLEGFVRREIRHFAEGWRVEARELKVEGTVAGLRFSGRIDRLDRRGEEAMALDYKSGSIKAAQRKSSLEKLTDFQMSIYRLLLRPRYPELTTAFIPLLEGGGYEALTAPEEKEALLLERLEALANTRSFVAEKTQELSRCTYCPYQQLCGRGEYL